MSLPALQSALLASALALAAAACGGPEPEPLPEPAPAPDPAPAPVPGPGEELSIGVSPGQGSAASDVTLRAAGFEPGATVQIGFGPPESEYDVIDRATADAGGRVETAVTVPDWAEEGRDYVFVAVAPDRRKVVSGPFRVTGGGGGGEEGTTIEVRGVSDRG